MINQIRRLTLMTVKVLSAGVISLALLSMFSKVYLNTGIHIKNETGATDYKWESNQYKATMNEGFAWFKMDEEGFNNAFPRREDVDVLLMGSSHMEAYNVPSNKNVGYLLNQYLPTMDTYNIGTSGHRIYACANNLKAAVQFYHPQYVIIETDRINLESQAMEEVLEGRYEAIKSYDSGLMYFIQKNVPLVKNIYKQLDDWWSSELVSQVTDKEIESANVERIPAKSGSDNSSDSGYIEMLDRFLAFIRDGGANSKVIILYQPILSINSDGTLMKSSDGSEVALFSNYCEKNDIMFVDASSSFEKLYEEQHILAHGFINTAIGTGHLNEYGHKVVAELLAQSIKEVQ